MRISKTDNLADKTDPSPGYLPWPPATKLPGSWLSNVPFFRELLDEIQNFDKFVNLQGLCDQVGELFKCSKDCECEAESSDESGDDSETKSDDDRDRLERNYCPPGSMELEDREFIILDQWIPRMSEAVEKLIELRGKMEARQVSHPKHSLGTVCIERFASFLSFRASLSKKNLEERLAFLDEEASRRLVKQLPPEISLPWMNNSLHCSNDDECGSNEKDNLGDDTDPHPEMSETSITTAPETEDAQLSILLQSLPAEILHDVILKAQDASPHIHFTLSHVNQFFRTFVITSPLLWSKINFWYPLSVTSLYLLRSAEASLDVIADQGPAPSPSPVIAAKEHTKAMAFYEILRPHRHRIRLIRVQRFTSLSWGAESGDADQSSTQSGGFPDHFLWSPMLCNLEHLDLGFRTWEGKEFLGLPVTTNLRELRLSGQCTPSILSLISRSLKHLTLNIPRLALPMVKNILSSTPSIESLTFLGVLLDPPSDITEHSVDVQSLKSLSIDQSSPSTIHRLLQLIACPNLHDLRLHFTGEKDPWYTSEYRYFSRIDVTQLRLFDEPRPQIRNFDIVSCEADPVFLETTLDNLPGLKCLRISSASLTNNHLEALVIEKPSDGASSRVPRCPQLTSLIVDKESEVSSIVVRRIVQSRMDASIPLQSVTLRGFDMARVFSEDLELIRKSGVVDLTISVFAADEAVESEKDTEWSSSWSSEEELEDELASGDDDVLDGLEDMHG